MEDRTLELKRAGNRLLVSRNYEAARNSFQALVESAPDLPDGYIGMAKVNERLNDYEGTVRLLEPVVSRFDSTHLRRLLADAYRVLASRGQSVYLDSAIRIYEAHLRERDDPVVLFFLAALYQDEKRDYARALELYRKYREAYPRSREAYLAIVDCLKRLGRRDEIEAVQEEWERHGGQRDLP